MLSMEFFNWVGDNWFTFLQSLGIVGGLFFTGLSSRIDAKVRRAQNGFEITKQHREIWTQLYERPDLKRVLDPAADLKSTPVSADEEMFVNFLILHLASAYRAMKNGVFVLPDELRLDASAFLSLPIPKSVWDSTRRFRNAEFLRWVESQLREPDSGSRRQALMQ
jgi:hypothetical protein